MENTLENKAKFFAQYWGQKVKGSDLWNCKEVKVLGVATDSEYLELTPLSQITNEDAKIFLKNQGDMDCPETELFVKPNSEHVFSGRTLSISNGNGMFMDYHVQNFTGRNFDLLRGNGYAVEWNGVSVETLVEWGWVKLKSE